MREGECEGCCGGGGFAGRGFGGVGAFEELGAFAVAFFGSGARVLPRLTIGAGCMVGAGAVVVRGCEDGVTLYAAPARRL